MEEKALKHLESLAVAAHGLPGSVPHVVLAPKDSELHDLETFLPERTRFRAKMDTASITSFIAYVEHRSSANAECYVDGDKMRAIAYFNIGTEESPGHADNKSSLTLKATAAYRAMRAATEKTFSQRDLASFMEDWRDHIDPVVREDDDKLSLIQAIAAIRNVKIEAKSESDHSERDFGASRSSMQQINAKAKDSNLPYGIEFGCQPYSDLRSRQFFLRLNLNTSKSEPTFTLQWGMREQDEEEIAEEFQDLLKSQMDEAVAFFIGDINF